MKQLLCLVLLFASNVSFAQEHSSFLCSVLISREPDQMPENPWFGWITVPSTPGSSISVPIGGMGANFKQIDAMIERSSVDANSFHFSIGQVLRDGSQYPRRVDLADSLFERQDRDTGGSWIGFTDPSRPFTRWPANVRLFCIASTKTNTEAELADQLKFMIENESSERNARYQKRLN